MTDRKQQPAQLKRRIAVLEGQLEAEREASLDLWHRYRQVLYELVEGNQRLEAVEKALRGEA